MQQLLGDPVGSMFICSLIIKSNKNTRCNLLSPTTSKLERLSDFMAVRIQQVLLIQAIIGSPHETNTPHPSYQCLFTAPSTEKPIAPTHRTHQLLYSYNWKVFDPPHH